MTTPNTAPASATEPTAAPTTPAAPRNGRRFDGDEFLKQVFGGSVMITILAIVLSLVVGGVLIMLTDEAVQAASGYFFARPGDTIVAVFDAVGSAYSALFQGAVVNLQADNFTDAIRPFFDTLTWATPLIAAALGISLAFRAGMFNIGARGQILVAAIFAGWVGGLSGWPPVVHLVVALIAGVVGGALWGGIAGLLKARTGAHEVIVTIMLNYVAFYLLSYLLQTPVLQEAGSNNPRTAGVAESAVLPQIFGPQFAINYGFVLVIAATIAVWWLLDRSALGFQFRALGENPSAARTAGMNVKNLYFLVMVFAGGLAGLAGSTVVLGTQRTGFSAGVDSGIGFDAITVALLGRAKPWGTFWAGILFGAFKAGSFTMQAREQVPIDIVLVVQAVIVLFIAAPPLVRQIFRLPTPGVASKREQRRNAARAARAASQTGASA